MYYMIGCFAPPVSPRTEHAADACARLQKFQLAPAAQRMRKLARDGRAARALSASCALVAHGGHWPLDVAATCGQQPEFIWM